MDKNFEVGDHVVLTEDLTTHNGSVIAEKGTRAVINSLDVPLHTRQVRLQVGHRSLWAYKKILEKIEPEEELVKFGEDSKGDINARFMQTATGYTLKGERPFGGMPMTFAPMPEGYYGEHPIMAAESLSEIVRLNETAIFRMGSNPTGYYCYVNGACYLFHEIKKLEEK